MSYIPRLHFVHTHRPTGFSSWFSNQFRRQKLHQFAKLVQSAVCTNFISFWQETVSFRFPVQSKVLTYKTTEEEQKLVSFLRSICAGRVPRLFFVVAKWLIWQASSMEARRQVDSAKVVNRLMIAIAFCVCLCMCMYIRLCVLLPHFFQSKNFTRRASAGSFEIIFGCLHCGSVLHSSLFVF